ncbi:unnamed protein product [Cyclocybe aegerita]|uniref:F-box domain-containing protein n=1 Tax=Cyclocybe aegerita TaxID=1973307 RepID=A0A8S0W0K3_CYCAE|nr:unnamed protein product [Cyclocybe aegerita]
MAQREIIVHVQQMKEKHEAVLATSSTPSSPTPEARPTTLSPIQHLPVEIFREIALYALHPRPRGRVQECPLSLCQTCSTWRTVALSLPELWETLVLLVKRPRTHREQYRTRVLEWFGRAQSRPLTFFLFSESQQFSGDRPFYADLLQDIAAPMAQLDNLEVLEISNPGDYGFNEDSENEDVAIMSTSIFQQAPKLRSVASSNVFRTVIGAMDVLPWSRLTDLHVTESLPIFTWIEIMKLSPLLEVLHLRPHPERHRRRFPLPVHENLREFTVDLIYDEYSIVDIINEFEYPNLRTLRLEHDGCRAGPYPLPPTAFHSFRHLHSLTLNYGYRENPSYIIEILRETPKLRVLELYDVEAYMDTVFESMTLSASSLVPQLSTLRLEAHNDRKAFDPDTLASMIESRCFNLPAGFTPLEEVLVYSYHKWKEGEDTIMVRLSRQMESCQVAGLSFKVFNGNGTNGIPDSFLWTQQSTHTFFEGSNHYRYERW